MVQKPWSMREEFTTTVGTLHEHGIMPGLLRKEMIAMSQMHSTTVSREGKDVVVSTVGIYSGI
jgi:hypothetical protein